MRLLVICPTSSRPEGLKRMLESFERNTSYADIIFSIEDNEFKARNLEVIGNHRFVIGTGCVGAINRLYEENKGGYELFMMGADDLTYDTPQWDSIMIDAIKGHIEERGHKHCVAFADDKIHRGALCIHPIITRELCEKIGGYFPPNYMKHLYVDNAIHYIAQGIDSLIYIGKVLIEHHHFMNKKAEVDECYIRGNSPERQMIDQEIYKLWLQEKGVKIVSDLYKEIKK